MKLPHEIPRFLPCNVPPWNAQKYPRREKISMYYETYSKWVLWKTNAKVRKCLKMSLLLFLFSQINELNIAVNDLRGKLWERNHLLFWYLGKMQGVLSPLFFQHQAHPEEDQQVREQVRQAAEEGGGVQLQEPGSQFENMFSRLFLILIYCCSLRRWRKRSSPWTRRSQGWVVFLLFREGDSSM